jgi:hypothetical protein
VQYRPLAGGQTFIRLMFVTFAAFAALLVATSIKGDGPPLPFTAFWLFALGWNGYWWLFRVAGEISVDRETLTWSAAMRTRQVPVADLVRVRPARFSSSALVIEVTDGRPILTMSTKGVERFTAELRRLRPDLPVTFGRSR